MDSIILLYIDRIIQEIKAIREIFFFLWDLWESSSCCEREVKGLLIFFFCESFECNNSCDRFCNRFQRISEIFICRILCVPLSIFLLVSHPYYL
ncbi:hypothetical protein LguiA_015759 [Lonicera macranthoides]